MRKVKLLLLSISSAILFALAWPAVGGLSALIFLAFIPLLYVAEDLCATTGRKLKLLLYSYITFLLFNFLTTWWIYNASDWGAAMAIICNAIFMTTVFYLFHLTKKWVGIKQGYIALVIYWVAFEYVHLNWELSWSWLTFGNVFANNIKAIQWYEFTGVLGGSLLVLIVNVLFYLSIKNYLSNKKNYLRPLGAAVFLLIGSLFYSEVLYDSNEVAENKLQAVIVQPNIDPYTDKFGGMADSDQIDLMVSLSRKAITDSTDYLLLPETAIPTPTWEHDLEYQYAQDTMPHGILGMNAEMFDEYLKFIANRRLSQIGLPEQYPGVENPFPWMSEMMDLKKEKNSFETRVIEYQAGGTLSWDDED